MTLETLKEKIEQFIQLDEELEQAVRKYRASGFRRILSGGCGDDR